MPHPENEDKDKDVNLKEDESKKKDDDGHPVIDFEEKDEEKKDEGAQMADIGVTPPWATQLIQAVMAIAERVGVPTQEEPALPPEGGEDLSPVAGMRSEDRKNKKETTMEPKDIGALVAKATLKAMTPLVAKVDTLEKKNAEIEHKGAVRARMQAAEKSLQGAAMSDVVRGHLLKLAETQSDEDFKEAIECFKQTIPIDPPSDLGEFEALLAKSDSAPAQEADTAIQAFTGKYPGAKAAAWAKNQLSVRAAYRKQTPNDEDPMSADEWLEVNVRNERPNFS